MKPVALRRSLVGLVAVGCLLGSAVAWAVGATGDFWQASLLRIGLVLAVLWLALPSRGRPAAWAELRPASFVILLGVLLLTVRVPKIGLPLLVTLIAAKYAFSPRKRR